jgi:hypothetical protein
LKWLQLTRSKLNQGWQCRSVGFTFCKHWWTMARSYKCRQRVNVRMVADLVSCSSFFLPMSAVSLTTTYRGISVTWRFGLLFLSLSLLFFLEVVVVTTVDFWISLHTFFLSPPLFLSFPLSALFSSSFFFLRILLPFHTVHPTLSLFLFFILLITFSPLTFYEPPLSLSLFLNIIPFFFNYGYPNQFTRISTNLLRS